MNRKRGYLLIVLTGLIFSTTEAALKLLAGQFAPMQLTVERVLIGALCLLPFALRDCRRRGSVITGRDRLYFAANGFVAVAIQMTFLQLAVMEIDASAAAALYSGSPIFSLLFAHFLLHEPIRKNHIAALALMTAAILLIVNPVHWEMSPRGFAYIMLATVSFGAYSTLCKLRLDRFSGITIACFALLCGGLEMLAVLLLGRSEAVAALYERAGLGIFARVPLTSGFTAASALALLYVGIVVAGVGFFLTAQITKDTSATEASFVYLLKPVFAAALAAAVLHEHISPNRMLGIAIYIAASLCVSIPLLREMKKEQVR